MPLLWSPLTPLLLSILLVLTMLQSIAATNWSVVERQTLVLFSNLISTPLSSSSVWSNLHLPSYNYCVEGSELSLQCDNDGWVVSVDLTKSNLVGQIPPSISTLSHLKYLRLNDNGLHGEIPASIGTCTALVHLWLSNNRLHGPIPTSIIHLQQLQWLWLSENNINGTIPLAIYSLVNLIYFDGHSNNITGTISPEIGKLRNLRELSLYNNELSGSIPDTIATLPLHLLYIGHQKSKGFNCPIPSYILEFEANVPCRIPFIYYIGIGCVCVMISVLVVAISVQVMRLRGWTANPSIETLPLMGLDVFDSHPNDIINNTKDQ